VPHLASAQQRVEPESLTLSEVESVSYVATFINLLAATHSGQKKLDALKRDDFVGRM
jgi:hypothetical protein